ncbi:uncharacterized protein [Macrobrachium rosenbergii]|uniref:uncharacterized protein n=1 Tax=Macrobrachium rosenbergii TaxID=79674 RepID=UPI0034D4CC90
MDSKSIRSEGARMIGGSDRVSSADLASEKKHSASSPSSKPESSTSHEGSSCGSGKHSSHGSRSKSYDFASWKKVSPYNESKRVGAHYSRSSPDSSTNHKRAKKILDRKSWEAVSNKGLPGHQVNDSVTKGPTKQDAVSRKDQIITKAERKKRGLRAAKASAKNTSPVCQEALLENASATFGDTFTSSDNGVFESTFDCPSRKPFNVQEKLTSEDQSRDGTELDFNVEVFSGDETDSRDFGSSSSLVLETPVKPTVDAGAKFRGSFCQCEARLSSPGFVMSSDSAETLGTFMELRKPVPLTPRNYCNNTQSIFWMACDDDVSFGSISSGISQEGVPDRSLGKRSHLSDPSSVLGSPRLNNKSDVAESIDDDSINKLSVMQKNRSDSELMTGFWGYWDRTSRKDREQRDGCKSPSAVVSPSSHDNEECNENVGPNAEDTWATESQKQPTTGKTPTEIKRETSRMQIEYIKSVLRSDGTSRSPSEEGKMTSSKCNQTFPGATLKPLQRLEHSTPLSEKDDGSFKSFKRSLSFEKVSPISSRKHEKCRKGRRSNESKVLSPKGFSSKMEWKPIQSFRFSEDANRTSSSTMPAYNEALIKKDFSPGFIDSHCHLDFLFTRTNHTGSLASYRLKCENREAFPASFEGCVAVFCDPRTFQRISWWEEIISEANIWGAFGCHPHFVSRFSESEVGFLRHAIQNENVVALGEIGLDYSDRNNECPSLQKEVFRKQLMIALEYKKPIVIHCRDAHRDCINILKEVVPKDHLIHRHCFTDSLEEAEEWLNTFSNSYLGFTGLILQSNKRARLVREVVQHVPLDRILLETDAPYFRPFTSGLSHPGMAIHVAAEIADIKGLGLQEVLQFTRENTFKMYRI